MDDTINVYEYTRNHTLPIPEKQLNLKLRILLQSSREIHSNVALSMAIGNGTAMVIKLENENIYESLITPCYLYTFKRIGFRHILKDVIMLNSFSYFESYVEALSTDSLIGLCNEIRAYQQTGVIEKTARLNTLMEIANDCPPRMAEKIILRVTYNRIKDALPVILQEASIRFE